MAPSNNDTANNIENQTCIDNIEERLQQYANVNITTSLDRIALTLNYLAQCDYAFGNSGTDIDSDGEFGRGYLLDMLSDGINYFAKNFEETESLYLKQQTEVHQNLVAHQLQKSKVEMLSAINDKYQQLVSLSDLEQEQRPLLEQQISELTAKLADLK